MTDMTSSNLLVDALVGDLKPVRRLWAPWQRVCIWIGALVAIAAILAPLANLPAITHKLMAGADMWLALVGSVATAVLAAVAAVQLCLPDRSARWALLPLPGLAVWVAASGMGCAHSWTMPGLGEASFGQSRFCLTMIIGFSVPLSLVMLVLIRRGYASYPSLTAAMSGLAAAAAGASLLTLFHPYDAAVQDLLVHAIAIAIVVGVNQAIGSALLARRRRRPVLSHAPPWTG